MKNRNVIKKLTTVGARAKHARLIAGKTQRQAAADCGSTPSAIQKVESNTVKETLLIFKMAQAYSVNAHWLRFGDISDSIVVNRGISSTNITECSKMPVLSMYIPLVTWQQVTQKINRHKLEEHGHADWIQLSGDGNLNTSIALKIMGDSMVSNSPRELSFHSGQIIQADQSAEPYDGAFVIARFKENESAILRKYVLECGDYWLRPLNPQYPAISVNRAVKIIAVVFQMSHLFTRPKKIPHLLKRKNK